MCRLSAEVLSEVTRKWIPLKLFDVSTCSFHISLLLGRVLSSLCSECCWSRDNGSCTVGDAGHSLTAFPFPSVRGCHWLLQSHTIQPWGRCSSSKFLLPSPIISGLAPFKTVLQSPPRKWDFIKSFPFVDFS